MSTPAGVAPRRSSRLASSALAAGAAQPSSSPLSRRRRRGASPSGLAREVDNEREQHVEAQKLKNQGEEVVEAEEPEEMDNTEVLKELPGWLPDGWIMEVRRGDNGNIYRYYTSPVSWYTFSTKMEALHYLFSEMDERVLESQACANDNELRRMHAWLPHGWVIEIRAGGKKMEKMYKFYVHLPTGMRFLSKENVLLYSNEGKISKCEVKGLCDTSSEDNILAMVEFNPDGLPEGWVKEIIFRKCNDGIRKDPYYTDPVSRHVFRTLKSVINYLETGEITKHAYIPRRSVTDMYSFDRCTDLPQTDGVTCLNLLSEPKEQNIKDTSTAGKQSASSNKAKRHGGSPQNRIKQTSTLDCTESSNKESKRIVVTKELGTGGGEQMSKENTMEDSNMKEPVVVIQELDGTRNKKRDILNLMTDPGLHDHKNDHMIEASEKLACTSIHKFYVRRSSNHTVALKKG
uniref:MBD domain-containing protein n=1 Tax=Leersia perrieri TaxID=77586 RepID=A0A0D9W301_9ORYZ